MSGCSHDEAALLAVKRAVASFDKTPLVRPEDVDAANRALYDALLAHGALRTEGAGVTITDERFPGPGVGEVLMSSRCPVDECRNPAPPGGICAAHAFVGLRHDLSMQGPRSSGATTPARESS